MNHTRPLTIALLLLAAALSACSPQRDMHPAARAQAAPPQGAPAAVARGKIEVEGGLLDLAPASAGVVRQLAVKEGQQVQKGQLLLRLADDEQRAELGVAQSELQLAQARARARVARLPALRQTLERWQAAVREGAAEAQGLDEATQALQAAQSDAQVAEAEVAVARKKLEQLQTQLKRLELHAPEAGVAVRVAAQPGAPVASGAPAVVLLPARPLLVRAELNESFVPAVRVGMRANVVADGDGGGAQAAFPEARVLRISPVYSSARLQDDPLRGPVRVVDCLLAFDQPPQAARVGQNVRVTFHE
ncbi:MAG: HlyD family efflux transporter periplasmic adaptor subunit [Proteobacteria bacterium]|nr:HlyD family efflux transporter periplasmic adaptor subunit [Pseudomonadota bacterium]MBS0493995.1 HlyD family efflux transporter periplasmic adaptor subunit [Pseudomonadota bacterium]